MRNFPKSGAFTTFLLWDIMFHIVDMRPCRES